MNDFINLITGLGEGANKSKSPSIEKICIEVFSQIRNYAENSKDFKEKSLTEIILKSIPKKLERKTPIHRSNSLLILAWAANIDTNEITFRNPAFVNFFGDQLTDLDDFYDSVDKDWNFEIMQEFRNSMVHFLQKMEFPGVSERKPGQVLLKTFTNELQREGKPFYVIGQRIEAPAGIPIISNSGDINFFDLVLIFNLKDHSLKPKSKDDIISIQGVMIPCDDRNKIYAENVKQTAKAAVSQVLARNMSHNIGSHSLVSVSTQKGYKNLMEKIAYNPTYKAFVEYRFHEYSQLNFGELSAVYNSYLKSRMDFLADIATSVPTLESSRRFFQDMLIEFDKNRMLTNTISGVDDFIYGIVPRYHDGKECAITNNLNENTVKHELVRSYKELKFKHEVHVAIPNDVLGYQAFYIIVENIIRNCAKHGGTSNKRNGSSDISGSVIERNNEKNLQVLDININIDDCVDTPYYEVTIWDNKLIPEEKFERDRVYYKQNENILSRVLDSDNRLRLKAWGMLEMKAAAAYLRKVSLEDLDDVKYNYQDKVGTSITKDNALYKEHKVFPLLQAFKKTHEQFNIKNGQIDKNKLLFETDVGHYHLGYRFYLLKPKKVLVLDFDYENPITVMYNIDDTQLLSSGVLIEDAERTVKYLQTQEKTSDNLNGEFILNRVYGHDLLIINLSNTDKANLEKYKVFLRNNLNSLPTRVIINAEVESSEFEEFSFIVVSKVSLSSLETNLTGFIELINQEYIIKLARKRKVCIKASNNVAQDIEKQISLLKYENLGFKCTELTCISLDHGKGYDKEIERYKGKLSLIEERLIKDVAIDRMKISELLEIATEIDVADADKYNVKKKLKAICRRFTVASNRQLFIEPYGSYAEGVYGKDLDEKRIKTQQSKLYESYLLNALVIDERIQEVAFSLEEAMYDGVQKSYYEIYNNCGIYVPHKEENCNLNTTSFGTISQRLKSYIYNKIKYKQVDFLVIHLGIIEKMMKSELKEDGTDWNSNKWEEVEQYIANSLWKVISLNQEEQISFKPKWQSLKLIFVSGRGKPANLPPNRPFINYSVLAQYLVDTRLKYYLIDLLISAKRL